MRALLMLSTALGVAACMERSPYQADAYLLAAYQEDRVNDMLVVGNHLYWTQASWSTGVGSVWRAAKDGSDEPLDMLGDAGGVHLTPFKYQPLRLAVDADYVYWTNAGDNQATPARPGQLSRRRKDRSEPPETVARPAATGTDPPLYAYPCGLAVDATSVVWSTFRSIAPGSGWVRSVTKAEIDPATPPEGAVVISDTPNPNDPGAASCAVALNGGLPWWVAQDGALWTTGSGTPAVFAGFAGGQVSDSGDMSVDAARNLELKDDVWYWGVGRTLVSVPNRDGAATANRAFPNDVGEETIGKLMLDSTDIYWITGRQNESGTTARLWRGRRSFTGEPIELVDDEPSACAQDEAFLYYAVGNGIYRIEK